MLNNRTLNQGRSRTFRKWLVLCVCVGALLPMAGDAQGLSTVLKSGLQTVPGGHVLEFTASEAGALDSASIVTVEFRDAADKQRAFKSATLKRNQPVILRLMVPKTVESTKLRTVVKYTPIINALGSEPFALLEDVDPAFAVIPGDVCAIPAMDSDTSVGGGAEGNCGGWRVTFTSSGSPTSLD
jgi:hypothetical protein